MISIWETIEDKFISDYKIFKVRIKSRQHPQNGMISDFVTLDSPDWVNIIPVTPENKIVMIEQYRHGTNQITLEIPGGMIESGEEPKIAAMRECREETGYFSNSKPEEIGMVYPNPAFLNNKCTTFIWKNCTKTTLQNLDLNEIINIKEFSLQEVKSMILNGTINHAVILNAFFFLFLHQDFKIE